MARNSLISLCWIFAATMMFAACSFVDMENRVEGTDSVAVGFSVEWPEGAVPSDEMYVAAGRVVNSLHYLYVWPSETMGCRMSPGEYYMAAFSRNPELYDAGSAEIFRDDPSLSLRNVSVTLMGPAEEEIDSLLGSDRTDFNMSVPYVYDAGEFYTAVTSETLSAPAPEQYEVVLYPNRLTQNLTVRFYVDADEGVSVESVTAELSGVVGRVFPLSGTVDDDELSRVILPVEARGTSGAYMVYEGNVNVFGLFPSDNAELTTGKGILQIAIRARSDRGEKIFHAGINLMNTIRNAGLMKVSAGGDEYSVAVGSALLDVDPVLRIRNGEVVGNSGDSGVDAWFGNEKIDVEI